MYDTYVTIVGNVLTAPEWRRTKNTGSLVAHFKVASTARRLDRESGQWVDGNSFRVRVNCWRRLAEGVGGSLITGDPVIVVGRLYTRDWVDENNNRRIGYELEAVAVGHDLSRGQSRFLRNRPAMSTSAVEDERGTVRIGGEHTEPVPAEQVPARRDDREFDDLGPGIPTRPVVVGGGYGEVGRGYDPLDGDRGGFEPVPGGATGSDAVPGDELIDAANDLTRAGHHELAAGGALAGEDDLVGEDDDLGATDDLGGEQMGGGLSNAGPFAGGVAATPFPAGATEDDSEPGLGDPETESDKAGRPDASEEQRGRGRRRGRTPVPV